MDKKYSIEFSRLNFETLNDLVKKKKSDKQFNS